jgi:hypothetical protein
VFEGVNVVPSAPDLQNALQKPDAELGERVISAGTPCSAILLYPSDARTTPTGMDAARSEDITDQKEVLTLVRGAVSAHLESLCPLADR